MKPLIGIIAAVSDGGESSIGENYVRAIEKFGGIPLIIPYTKKRERAKDYALICDGFLFAGGKDIHPRHYGEEILDGVTVLQKLRDAHELLLFEEINRTEKPILAICRGAQLINVALGGTLYQDIDTQYKTEILHRQKEDKASPSHKINVLRNTPLYSIVKKDRIPANSFHHQAIKDLGQGLYVMARADDGIIEAVYRESPYIMAYQWHPERLADSSCENAAIFTDFISSVKSFKEENK